MNTAFSLEQLPHYWQQFTWLRPTVLWLLLPLPLLAWWHLRKPLALQSWQALIAPELLRALRATTTSAAQPPRWGYLALAWCISVLALAGPSFSQQELNTLKLTDALVIVLDLSPSMLAEDIKPSRLQAAHFKILDILSARQEGYTALIAYAGSTHVVAPLSDDANTLAALVPSLTPNIMPKLGSQAEDAVEQAISLLKNAQFSGGRIVLFTDEVVPQAAAKIAAAINKASKYQLTIVGVGTEQGAPVPMANGEFIRDASGQVIMNPLPWQDLNRLANDAGAKLLHIQRDAARIESLADAEEKHASRDKTESKVDLPQDHGFWLLPLIVLFAALAFLRRQYLLPAACVLVLAFAQLSPSYAQTIDQNHSQPDTAVETSPVDDNKQQRWRDLWQTPDQQASKALANGDAETAYQRFEDPQWKANAAYATGRYAEAEQLFSQAESASAIYNTANAQAQQGKLQEAIANYQRALELDPTLADAEANKQLLEELLKQQEQQQQPGEQGQQGNGENSQPEQAQQQDQQSASEQQGDQASDSQQDGQNTQQQAGEQQNAQQQAGKSGSKQQSNTDNADAENSEAEQSSAQQNQQQSAEQQASEQQQSIAQRAAEDANKDAAQQQAEQQQTEQQRTADLQRAENQQQTPPDSASQMAVPSDESTEALSEEQQALEQQLRRVPDDPAGLLRNKFNYYYQLDRHRRQPSGQQEQPRW